MQTLKATPAAHPPRSRAVARNVLHFLVLLGFVVLLTAPLWTAPASLLPPHWDPPLFSWVMASNSLHLGDPTSLFQGNAFYPHGSSVTYSEPLLTPTAIYAPIFLSSGNPILAYNLTLWFFWALSGLTMSWLAYGITGDRWAAFLAGLIFVGCPYRLEYYLEFQMQLTVGMPVALLGWYRFLVNGRWRWVWLSVSGVLITAFATLYYAIILGLALAAFTLLFAACRPGGWSRAHLYRGSIAAAAAGLAMSPIAVAYSRTQSELGFSRVLVDQPLRHSADVLTYLEARHGWLYDLPIRTDAETALFMGFIPLALAVWGWWTYRQGRIPDGCRHVARWASVAPPVCLAGFVVSVFWLRASGAQSMLPATLLILTILSGCVVVWAAARRNRDDDRHLRSSEWVGILTILALAFFVLSLGRWIRVGGEVVGPGIYQALYAVLAPLEAIRVTTRFGVVVMMAMSLLAAFGLRALRERLPTPWRGVAAAALLLGVAAEFYGGPLDYARQSWPPPSSLYDQIRETPGDFAVIEIPLRATKPDSYQMLNSTYYRKYLVNGNSGFEPPLTVALAESLRRSDAAGFPSQHSRQLLQSIHPLRFLLVDYAKLDVAESGLWHALRNAPLPDLHHVGSSAGFDLYDYRPAPEEGSRFVRRFSFDYGTDRPIVEFNLTPATPAPRVSRFSATLTFNGETVAKFAPTPESTNFRFDLSGRMLRASANEIEIVANYDLTVADGNVDYMLADRTISANIRVRSRRTDALVEINSLDAPVDHLGYTLITIDPETFQIIDQRSFATHSNPLASRALRRHIRRVPEGQIVVAVTNGAASTRLTDEALFGLRQLGSSIDLREHGAAAHALIGIKGARPGSAREAVGFDEATVLLGEPPDGFRYRLAGFRMSSGS